MKSLLSLLFFVLFACAGMAWAGSEIIIPTEPEPLPLRKVTSLVDYIYGGNVDDGCPKHRINVLIIGIPTTHRPHSDECKNAFLSVIPDSMQWQSGVSDSVQQGKVAVAYAPWNLDLVDKIANELGGAIVIAPVSTADIWVYYHRQTWNKYFWFVNKTPNGVIRGPYYHDNPPDVCQWGISTGVCDPITGKPISVYGPSLEFLDSWNGVGGNRESYANAKTAGKFWLIRRRMIEWLRYTPDGQQVRQMCQGLAGPGSLDSLGRWESRYGVIDITPAKIDSVLFVHYGPPVSASHVELLDFSAKVFGQRVQLSWTTASETNNYGFEVQRKLDGEIKFRKIGFVDGHGTTTLQQKYQFNDHPSLIGIYWYRLKQIDISGTAKFLEPIKVEVNKFDVMMAQNFPNPFNPITTIKYSLPQGCNVIIKIYDLQGREIATLIDGMQLAGEYSAVWNATGQPSGIYIYHLSAGGIVKTGRMMFLK